MLKSSSEPSENSVFLMVDFKYPRAETICVCVLLIALHILSMLTNKRTVTRLYRIYVSLVVYIQSNL